MSNYSKSYTNNFPITSAVKNDYKGAKDNQEIKIDTNLNNINKNVLLVSSEDRDWNTQDANRFVHSIELIDGSVPTSGYNIINKCLNFNVGSTEYIINIPDGYYSIKTLLETIEHKMNKVSNLTFDLSVDKLTHHVHIHAHNHHEFELLFTDGEEFIGEAQYGEIMTSNDNKTGIKEFKKMRLGTKRNKYINNSIGKMLGFKPINLTDNHEYTSQFGYNMLPYPYLGLFITTDKHQNIGEIASPNSNMTDAFAILYLNNDNYTLSKLDDHVGGITYKYIKYMNPPISFKSLKIEFKTPDGNRYHFNGKENYLLLELGQMFERNIIRTNEIL
jgi:hypothetical protein